MDTSVKNKKLQTLPWYALHDIAVKKGVEEKEVNGKEKNTIIDKILSYGILSDEEIEQYVNDYIYGDRVTFTLWTFQSSLKDSDYGIVNSLENVEEEYLSVSGYRKLKILSVKEYEDRTEVLYVYSKEYTYVNEDGQNASVWEQHRGCLWIGKASTYLACISKHEKMTAFMTKYIADLFKNPVTQIKPPKSAIDKCTNSKAISRIVLQGKGGEKTIVSRAGGITPDQEEEISRIRSERIDTSGSFISAITENIDATIKYNVRNGSIGIYKHLPASVLFEWSENSIKIILEEIDKLPRVRPENVLILKYYSFENYFLNPQVMARLHIVESEEAFYETLLEKWNEYLHRLSSGQHLQEVLGKNLETTADIREHMEDIKTYIRGHNLFDIFYGRYKEKETELLERYIEIAPKEDFQDILAALEKFPYFESRRV